MEAYVGSWTRGKFSGEGKYALQVAGKLEWRATGQWKDGVLKVPDSKSKEEAGYEANGPQMKQVGRL